jgi:dTDP-4-dehydrorhamnose reductase
MPKLELWGGHECTVNRVGDTYIDQTVLAGHQDRIEDLSLFAELGLKALRYPVLWERIAPERPDARDWAWSDERLGEIRRLGMRPIAGLLHHGSGPAYTSLVADNFVEGLADFAQATAERYPWIEEWTPVNEPLTTARFSALYGHWYPHAKDERLFWVAFLNQIDAVRAAMQRIREVNPAARLVQTEDLGQTYATPPLGEQAAFDNHRRWLTWDLLTGRVDKDHPFWARFARFGLTDRLRAIADAPCPPDVVGVNHYLTSERFLDHRVERYPDDRRGGNDYIPYADVEAVRVMSPGPVGLAGLMDQAWDRYGLPLAITEAHNGCTREEQMRWTLEAWRAAERLNERGGDVRAVTAWALLGSHDWNSLLTVQAGHYEAGAFDLRGGADDAAPRPNAMTRMLGDLAAERPVHPVARGQGWWRRDVRLEFQPAGRVAGALPPQRHFDPEPAAATPILIAGASGTLGQALARCCQMRGLSYVLTDRGQMALGDNEAIQRTLERHRPWAVINAAGWVRVDEAELEPDACREANLTGALNLERPGVRRAAGPGLCRERPAPAAERVRGQQIRRRAGPGGAGQRDPDGADGGFLFARRPAQFRGRGGAAPGRRTDHAGRRRLRGEPDLCARPVPRGAGPGDRRRVGPVAPDHRRGAGPGRPPDPADPRRADGLAGQTPGPGADDQRAGPPAAGPVAGHRPLCSGGARRADLPPACGASAERRQDRLGGLKAP